MKTTIFKSLTFALLSVFLLTACSNKDQKDGNDSGELDMAILLTKKMVKEAFNVKDTVSMKPDFGVVAKNYIQYKWQIDSSENVMYYYAVTLNFAR